MERSKRKETNTEHEQKKRVKSQVSSLSKKIEELSCKLEKQQTDECELAHIATSIAAHAPNGGPKSKGDHHAKNLSFINDDEPYKAAALDAHKIIKRDNKSKE